MTAHCRSCAAALTRELIDLGQQPLANAYLAPTEEAIRTERRFPLRAMVCDTCLLVQVEETVPATAIFHEEYAYFSSYSSSWVDHAKRYVDAAIARFRLDARSMVVEIASNDGYLLQFVAAAGIPCLGIEPAANCAGVAKDKGVPSLVDFFTAAMARRLSADGRAADLMIANNVLAHVPDVHDFIGGIAIALKPHGVATFEFPHLLSMIDNAQFDTIYHEHYSYLSLAVVQVLLRKHGLKIFDVEHLSTHGGSLRVFACRVDAAHPESDSVSMALRAETQAGLDRPDSYRDFAPRAAAIRQETRQFLQETKRRGEIVVAYGAAAKGNTFLNYCGVSAADIPFVVDRNPQKQGRLLPGSHVPVRDPSTLAAFKPARILILPWNIAEEIAAEHAYVAEWGGRFVVAAPELRVL